MRLGLAALAIAALLPAGRALASAAASAPADSSGAATDSSLGGYLRALSDSTDTFFGRSSAPTDTAGLDSALAFRLAYPGLGRERRRLRAEPGPWLTFNRVDGPVYGGQLALRSRGAGTLSGRAGYAAGPNDWLGGGSYRLRWGSTHGDPSLGPQRSGEHVWTLETWVGRATGVLDPDRGESWQRVLRAFVNGSDRHSYLRRDGYLVSLERESVRWRAALTFRDQLESPRLTTTTWNLVGAAPEVIANLPARQGRAREIRIEAAARIPNTLVQIETREWITSPALGSDFDYRRWYVAAGGDVALGHVTALVPQLQYGHLSGDVVPQAAFYLGGPHSLRSLSTNEIQGTREALARLDLIFTPDLLALARIPHPSFAILQGGMFGAWGAAWGADPFGGPTVAGDAWPSRQTWIGEAGVSLLYRPGLPEPRGFVRLDYAHGVGSNPRHKVTLHYTVPLDLLRPIE